MSLTIQFGVRYYDDDKYSSILFEVTRNKMKPCFIVLHCTMNSMKK